MASDHNESHSVCQGVRVACQIRILWRNLTLVTRIEAETYVFLRVKRPDILSDFNGICEKLQVWIYTKFPLTEVKIISKKALRSLSNRTEFALCPWWETLKKILLLGDGTSARMQSALNCLGNAMHGQGFGTKRNKTNNGQASTLWTTWTLKNGGRDTNVR